MTAPQPLQKPLYLLKRLSTISREQFCDHWLHVHSAVLKSIPIWAKLRSGYVQNHLIDSGIIDGWAFPYDGVTQVYVRPGTESGPRFPELPVFRERVIPDEKTFLDRECTIVIKTLEHIAIPGTSPVKVLVFHRRRAGTTRQDFIQYWKTTHKDILLSQADFTKHLRGYRQNQAVDEPNRYLSGDPVPVDENYDGASEYWFDSVEAARSAFETTGYQIAIRSDSSSLFDTKREIACLVHPHVILPE